MTSEQKQAILSEANWCLSMTGTASNPAYYTARLTGVEVVLHAMGYRLEVDDDVFSDIVEA